MKKLFLFAFSLFVSKAWGQSDSKSGLIEFAQSTVQWTGIAISPDNRIFVCFPRWGEEEHIAVAEIVDSIVVPFPNKEWNDINEQAHFICVQSIYADKSGCLWVLDTGYKFETDSTNSAYFYCFDLKTGTLKQKFVFPVSAITGKSYLNDFRIDTDRGYAYFTDSQAGGIVTLNMKTREIRRELALHPSTMTEVAKISVEGYERKHPVNSDGIELDDKNEYLYYSSLMGKYVYRIPVYILVNTKMSDRRKGDYVERYADTGANDGIIMDKHGNIILSSLEKNAISLITPNRTVKTVIADKRIQWPDSFAFDSDGALYFTISKIHLPKEKRGKYKIFKLPRLID
ncbi:MAG: hypothetical protein HZA79_00130 [Sphingobacteriales bacterium]|nr:hypothetical protein [Sphingobacteriales bacterium]